MRSERGHTLLEVVVALAMLGVLAFVSASAAEAAMRGVSLLAATSELRAVFAEVRMQAVARDRNLGIKFRNAGDTWTWSVYEDRDGDGVRNDDIRSGVDAEIRRPRRFDHRPAVIGLPDVDVPDPLQPNALLGARAAVRFNESTLCSFSRQGEATNGSVVLTDGVRATILRVDGASGRVDLYRWNGTTWKVEE